MDTEDYIKQCMTVLPNTNTYRRTEYLTKDITNLLTNTLINFKHTLYNYNKHLYNYSYQTTNTTRYLSSMACQQSTKGFNTYYPSDLSSHIVTPLSPKQHDYWITH